jgi:hypothetical protein
MLSEKLSVWQSVAASGGQKLRKTETNRGMVNELPGRGTNESTAVGLQTQISRSFDFRMYSMV